MKFYRWLLQLWRRCHTPPSPPVIPAAPVMFGPDVPEPSYTLQWSAPAGATSYLLDMAEPGWEFFIFQDEPTVSPSFFYGDVSEAPRVTRVRAVNAAGISPYSNEFSYTT